jgi:hypothetical protein
MYKRGRGVAPKNSFAMPHDVVDQVLHGLFVKHVLRCVGRVSGDP